MKRVRWHFYDCCVSVAFMNGRDVGQVIPVGSNSWASLSWHVVHWQQIPWFRRRCDAKLHMESIVTGQPIAQRDPHAPALRPVIDDIGTWSEAYLAQRLRRQAAQLRRERNRHGSKSAARMRRFLPIMVHPHPPISVRHRLKREMREALEALGRIVPKGMPTPQRIRLRGMFVEDAAVKLLDAAPAFGDFFGIELAAYPGDGLETVLGRYRAEVNRRAAMYWDAVPQSLKERVACDACGARGCKLWREYNTCLDFTKLLCGACAIRDQKKTGDIDDEGRFLDTTDSNDIGCRHDSIGWLVPAVPTSDGSFWGYTSVPEWGCVWWRRLPNVGVVAVAEAA